ncbi:cyclase family protein [Salinactinospora qingdaonensis]|uniref:Cyclase family protein n=1 Tax=Salinactinospora qingdaonensis TaxID=702744 RepID=A0ABP7FSS0_9ACTN
MNQDGMVDLSRPLGPDTQVYPGDPPVTFTPVATPAEDGCGITAVSMSSQSGTHADAPRHFFAGGAGIDELPLELFTGPAVVVDVTGRPDRCPIGWEDLAPREADLGAGVVVLLRTGWSAHYGTPHYFAHPYLSGEAARRLVAAGVRTLGIDAPSPDVTPEPGREMPADGFAVHEAVLGAGGVIVENLCRLELLDFAAPVFSALPIPLAGADGAPVRAVAWPVR